MHNYRTYQNYQQRSISKIVSIFTQEWLNIAHKEFIVVDIETTGLDKNSNHIIEVAAIRYRNCAEVDKFVTLINPRIDIPHVTTRIHGITNKAVENSPTIETVMPELLKFLGNSLLTAHNANFDIGFIETWANKLGYKVGWNYVDTISIARRMIPGLINYKQATVLNAIGYEQSQYHRAEDDCRGCAQIMKLGVDSLI